MPEWWSVAREAYFDLRARTLRQSEWRSTQRRSRFAHDGSERWVALLGNGPSVSDAPLDDPRWSVWGLNYCLRGVFDAEGGFRPDRWFEIHPLDERIVKRRRPSFFNEWLAQLPIPLYQFDPRWPHSVAYPLAEVLESTKHRYFSCTYCYQVALAIHEGATKIGIFGADMVSGREALYERPVLEFWLGLANGLGIDVVIGASTQGLYRHPGCYAYDCVYERQEVFKNVKQFAQGLPAYLREGRVGLQ